MKPYRIAAIVAIALIAYSMTACVTTETTTTYPDGTATHTRVVAPTLAADETAAAITGAVAMKVISEK